MHLVTLQKKLRTHGTPFLFLEWRLLKVLIRVVAGKGILSSAVATGFFGFVTAILFLFCTPDLEVLFSLQAPQPFVQLYALALGKKGSIFMTTIAVLGLIIVCSKIHHPETC